MVNKSKTIYKYYIYFSDIEEVEKKDHGKETFNVINFRFPCGTRYPRISARMNFEAPDNSHHHICKSI